MSEKGKQPIDKAKKAELIAKAEAAFLKLPFENRMLFSLVEMDGFDVTEIASMFQLPLEEAEKVLTETADEMEQNMENLLCSQELFEYNLIYCDAMVERVFKQIKEK